MITLLTIGEVATLLRCSKREVTALQLAYYRPGRSRLYARDVVLEHMRTNAPELLELYRKLVTPPPSPIERVRKGPPPDGSRHIYFVSDYRRVKIGSALDVDRRIKQLQPNAKMPLELLGTIPGDMKREKALHLKWQHIRLEGEWFSATPELLEFIRREALAP